MKAMEAMNMEMDRDMETNLRGESALRKTVRKEKKMNSATFTDWKQEDVFLYSEAKQDGFGSSERFSCSRKDRTRHR